MKKVLTPEMEKYFIENAYKESIKSMSRRFHISDSPIKRVFKKHEIKVPKEIQRRFKSKALKKPITEKENHYIINNLPHKSIKQIAVDLKRSSTTIGKQCKILGLEYILEKKKQESNFTKGHIPSNKGKKWEDFMSKDSQLNCRETTFKKGNIPPNKLADYEEIIRKSKKDKKYIMIRIPGEPKLVFKHIWLWEKENKKKLPKGFNIVFKDQNPMNCCINNLECISNTELMQRNSYHNNYPKEIQNLFQLKGVLTRQINKIKNN